MIVSLLVYKFRIEPRYSLSNWVHCTWRRQHESFIVCKLRMMDDSLTAIATEDAN